MTTNAAKLFCRTFFQHSGEGVCFITPNLTVKFCNHVIPQMLNLSPNEVIGKSLINLDLKIGEESSEWERRLVALAEKGEDEKFLVHVPGEDNERKLSVSFHAVRNEQNKNIGFVVIFGEVSRIVGKDFSSSIDGIINVCSLFFDDIPDMVFLVSPRKQILWANQKALDTFDENLHSMRKREFNTIFGKCPLKESCQLHSSLSEKHPVCEVELNYDNRFLVLLCVPIIGKDGVVCSMHWLRDVTETEETIKRLKASEESYRSVIENAKGFYVHRFDSEGHLILASPHIQEILGTPLERYLGSGNGWLEQIHPRDIERIATEIDYSFRNATTFDQVYRIIHGEKQSTVWVRTRFYPIFDEQGEVLYFDGITFDITEQKQIERQVISSERMKAIGEMTGGVAHNINNLLAGIMGNLQLLEMEGSKYLPPSALSQVQQAFLGSRRIAELVKQMLTFARAEESDDTWINVSVLAIINRVIKLTEPLWKDAKQKEGKEVRFKVDLPEDIQVVGNIHELTTLFNNLIVNAIESIDSSGSVTIKGVHEEDNFITVTIIDTGRGMKPETLKRSIEPLFSTKGTVGVGMGLSVAYGIAKKYRGDITISSKLNQGTTVAVLLPKGYKEEPELKLEKEIMIEGRDHIRVLVIEDEPDVREILAMFLEKRGYQVMVAASGHDGVKMFLEKPFEVVFTDLGMAGMTGWEVAQKIKHEKPGTLVYLLTGWGAEVEKEGEKMKYIDGVVYKPFDLEKLSNLLAKLSLVEKI